MWCCHVTVAHFHLLSVKALERLRGKAPVHTETFHSAKKGRCAGVEAGKRQERYHFLSVIQLRGQRKLRALTAAHVSHLEKYYEKTIYHLILS